MTLFSLIFALLAEQVRPRTLDGAVARRVTGWADWLGGRLDGGQRWHGVLAWLLAAGAPALAAWLIHLALYAVTPLLAFAWMVLVLYATLELRRATDPYNAIGEALRAGRLDDARARLAGWTGEDTSALSADEVARIAIEHALVRANRRLFGVVFWTLLLGPAGALLYRAAARVAETWTADQGAPRSAAFGWCARRAFELLDWLPARACAASFAVVGDFTGALECWQKQAYAWPRASDGALLAAAAGALGMRLGDPVHRAAALEPRPPLGSGDAADVASMQSATGLIWRALVLWLALLTLIGVAAWVG